MDFFLLLQATRKATQDKILKKHRKNRKIIYLLKTIISIKETSAHFNLTRLTNLYQHSETTLSLLDKLYKIIILYLPLDLLLSNHKFNILEAILIYRIEEKLLKILIIHNLLYLDRNRLSSLQLLKLYIRKIIISSFEKKNSNKYFFF